MSASRVHSVFVWLGQTPVGEFMRGSLLTVPTVVVLHLLGLVLLGGSTLIVTLSLWKVVLHRPSAPQFARELWPFVVAGVALTVVTGVLLVSANAQYYYDNTVFWVKLSLLLPAIVVSVLLHRHLRRAGDVPVALRWKCVGTANLLLWASVALAGRAIGLL